MDTHYPGAPDAAIEHYWSLRPLRFTEVEWLEIRRPVPWTEESTTMLRMRLRDPDSANEALALEFDEISELKLYAHEIMQVIELTISSLAGRGWEHDRYSVETPAMEQLSFYCRDFSAKLVQVAPMPQP